MSRIFLSHSSKNNVVAVAVHQWLRQEGWDDVFLDLDSTYGIHPGSRWERALYDHASECEAVLFLVSENWLASDWCRREYELARKLNKRIFVVLVEDIQADALPDYLRDTFQIVSLAAGTDHSIFTVTVPVTHEQGQTTFSREGLTRLKNGLTASGLDPRFFAWPPENEPERSPYRGLDPLEGIDAGVFFGRDASIVEALDILRGLREGANPRLLVLLGASGAGKSSFLRAGLLPRLARDDRNFMVLPVIRPERSVLTGPHGFVSALAGAALKRKIALSRGEVREAFGGVDTTRDLLRRLHARRTEGRPPTMVIAVDQAEELFRPEALAEREQFLVLMRGLAADDDPPVIILFAIRTDAYDELERAKTLEGLRQHTYPLLPMPPGAYLTVIEGPARRLAQSGRKLEIEPGLTALLLTEIEKGGGSDALPLLSFTLQQLFLEQASVGKLTRRDFERLNGLKGAIDAVVERAFVAADADARIPRDHDARLVLLRRGLIPWLAGVDPETKSVRRRIARLAQIPAEARPLIDLLVEQRLLTRNSDSQTGEATIEPAHEALLRQWGGLKTWLDEDFIHLAVLEGVKRGSRDWDANRRDEAWVAHRGSRLTDAEKLESRPDLVALFDATDRAYLGACRIRQNETQEKEASRLRAEARSARNAKMTAVVASVGATIALVLAVTAFWNWNQSEHNRQEAERRRVQAVFASKTAEDAARALVFDLSQKLRDHPGMPPTLVDTILVRAQDILDALASKLPQDPQIILLQVDGMLQQGQIARKSRRVDDAIAIYKKCHQILQGMPALAAQNTDYLDRAATALRELGLLQLEAGSVDAAISSFEQAIQFREMILTQDQSSDRWNSSLAVVRADYGRALALAGHNDLALGKYKESLNMFDAIKNDSYDRATFLSGRAQVYRYIGDLFRQDGNFNEALVAYQNAERDDESLGNSSSKETQINTANDDRAIGELYYKLGSHDDSLRYLRKGLSSLERIAVIEPDDDDLTYLIAMFHSDIGKILLEQDQPKQALGQFGAAGSNLSALASQDKSNQKIAKFLFEMRINSARSCKDMADYDCAALYARDAVAMADTWVIEQPQFWSSAAFTSHRLFGELFLAKQDFDQALREFNAAISRSLIALEAYGANDDNLHNLVICLVKESGLFLRLIRSHAAKKSAHKALRYASDLSSRSPDQTASKDLITAFIALERALYAQSRMQAD